MCWTPCSASVEFTEKSILEQNWIANIKRKVVRDFHPPSSLIHDLKPSDVEVCRAMTNFSKLVGTPSMDGSR